MFRSAVEHILEATLTFYRGLCYFTFSKGSYSSCQHFGGNTEAKAYVYSLSRMFVMWDQPHYRNPTFQVDLLKNLRNVAIPGTGVPLSVFATHKILMYLFIFCILPVITLISSILVTLKASRKTASRHHRHWILASLSSGEFWLQVSNAYVQQLLMPEDWFSLWQLNCRLSSWHQFVTQSEMYKLENKWEFLQACTAHGDIAGSPILDIPDIVVKDRNEEGGMGVFLFQNALNGGDWIIQKRLQNAPVISKLLPKTAPLSTFRVLTASTAWIDDSKDAYSISSVRPLTCVFRAGLAGAKTDHQSVLFDVDLKNACISRGTSNAHWYELGITRAITQIWKNGLLDGLTSDHDLTCHPDTGSSITGTSLGEDLCKEMSNVACTAHEKLLIDVPLIGWDVAVTSDGVFLLEANLSCNFFRGSFDRRWYFSMLDRFFRKLEVSYRIVSRKNN